MVRARSKQKVHVKYFLGQIPFFLQTFTSHGKQDHLNFHDRISSAPSQDLPAAFICFEETTSLLCAG